MLPSARRVLVELDPNPKVRSKPVIVWIAPIGRPLFGTEAGYCAATATSAEENCVITFCAKLGCKNVKLKPSAVNSGGCHFAIGRLPSRCLFFKDAPAAANGRSDDVNCYYRECCR